jgi:hypothetical protein
MRAYQTIVSDPKYTSVRWIANVLLTSCGKPATKLKALIKLIDAGREVSPLDFIMPYQGLRIDGQAVCTGPLLERGEIVEYTTEWYRQ